MSQCSSRLNAAAEERKQLINDLKKEASGRETAESNIVALNGVVKEGEKIDRAKTQTITELRNIVECSKKDIINLKTEHAIKEEDYKYQLQELTSSEEMIKKELLEAKRALTERESDLLHARKALEEMDELKARHVDCKKACD